MGSVISKWITPGIITVLVGTVVAVLFGQANVETDLTERAQIAISTAGDHSGADWAKIRFEGRDGILSGLTTDADTVQPLIEQLSSLHGVRSITSEVEVAPSASPYPFAATLADGEITLAGGVPSERVRAELLDETGANDGGLELLSGVPAGDWKAVALFAVSQLQNLEAGEASLANMNLSVAGVAKTPGSYVVATQALGGELPEGLSAATTSIEPAVVDDFVFLASRENGVTSLSGFVPDMALSEQIGALSGASANTLLLAQGAPEGFGAAVQYGLEVLNTMSSGEMEVSADGLVLSGTAASHIDFAAASALVADPPQGGLAVKGISVIPAVEQNYFWSTQKRADGSLTLRGYVPDEATREAVLARAGSGAIDHMQLASGAPATFYEDALVSISALKNLETGQAGLRLGEWYLRGNPALEEDAVAAEQALITARTPATKWQVAIAEAPPVPVVPYIWSARKAADGQILLKGNVPDELIRNALRARAGDGVVDELLVSFGAPETFYEDALVAISSLSALESGRAGHGLNGWYVSGQPLNRDAAERASNALITARTPASDWRVDLAAPLEAEPEPVPEPAPVAEAASPLFSALKSDGAIVLSGQVPDRDARNILGLVSGGASTTGLRESPDGVPDDFLASARTGIDALNQLSEGRLAYSQNEWTLSGIAPTPETLEKIVVALSASQTPWSTDFSVPSKEVICQNRIPQFSGIATIQFKTGGSQIAQNSMATLERLATYLKGCDALELRVAGYTDNQADYAGNLQLSTKRAEAVVAILAELGVEESRMVSVGFGETSPIASNDSVEGRRANQRIVFTISQYQSQ